MTRSEPAIFDIVVVDETEESLELEIAGAEAVVLGISEDEVTNEKWFAVQVEGLDVVMLPAGTLTTTGRSVPRTAIYSGETLRVSPDGAVVQHEPEC
ncbi:hypothetical protein [Cellulomonas phragmiteti]|uniref:Uncharacterized protein n=1 Tax=Cellulomonas phragmiteti TaxID=478780 RepID=A0ABQ4DND9_9CELL|nr:hypothetical protein [Cellulomonas phragmiteti]GIG40431.1 hypothetical protein Cph01nite_21930 [Cellulomonas phragmiteti]